MNRPPSVTLALLGAVLLTVSVSSLARVTLTTLPVRERVEIQLDHPTATLVEEERVVPLTKGLNEVDFAWANTRIEADSILLRVVEPVAGVEVVSVSYPPGENALVWSVAAAAAGSARVRISYLLRRLTKSFRYRALANADETRLELAQYLRVRNLANEEFRGAGIWIGYGEGLERSIGLDESREMLISRYPRIPIEKVYISDPQAIGYLDRTRDKLRVAMRYRLRNSEAGGLGRAPLPPGKVRIFQRDRRGGSAFIGEDLGTFTALGQELSLYVGLARDIVVRRVVERNRREPVAGNLFNQNIVIRYEMENFKPGPVTVELNEDLAGLRRALGGKRTGGVDWALGPDGDLRRGLDRERTTADRLVLRAPLPAATSAGRGVKRVRRLNLILRNEW